jgi:hypothetical protein
LRIFAAAREACAPVAGRPVPIAQIGSYAMTSRSASARAFPPAITGRTAARTWRSRTASVDPAANSFSDSPTHSTIRRSASKTRTSFFATRRSSSPWSRRTSEWPTIDPAAMPRSIVTEVWPVNAPRSSQCTSCA